MSISVHVVALSLDFTMSKFCVQFLFKCQSFRVQFLFECLSFTRVNVQCDVHSLIMSPFSVHVSWRGQGNRRPKTA